MKRDPVCGMDVDQASAEAQSEYGNQTFYFCSEECKQRFDANPVGYLGEAARAQTRRAS